MSNNKRFTKKSGGPSDTNSQRGEHRDNGPNNNNSRPSPPEEVIALDDYWQAQLQCILDASYKKSLEAGNQRVPLYLRRPRTQEEIDADNARAAQEKAEASGTSQAPGIPLTSQPTYASVVSHPSKQSPSFPNNRYLLQINATNSPSEQQLPLPPRPPQLTMADYIQPEFRISDNVRTKTKICWNWEATGECPYNTRCLYAHGIHQLRVPDHLPFYKTRDCWNFHGETAYCEYGPWCCYIHSGLELVSRQIEIMPIIVEEPEPDDNELEVFYIREEWPCLPGKKNFKENCGGNDKSFAMAKIENPALEVTQPNNSDGIDNQNVDHDQSVGGANSDDNNNTETVDTNANPVNTEEEVKDDKDDDDNRDTDECSLDSVETVKRIETDTDEPKSDDDIDTADENANDVKSDDEKTDDKKTDNEKSDENGASGDKHKESFTLRSDFCKIEEFIEENDGIEKVMFKIYENEGRSGPDATVTIKNLEMMEESEDEN